MRTEKKKDRIKSKIIKILSESTVGRKALQKELGKSVSEWVLKGVLVEMLRDKIIFSEGKTRNLVYKLSLNNSQLSILMDPLIIAADIPDQDNLSAYLPFLKQYFAYSSIQRGTKGYDRNRLINYKPNKTRLLRSEVMSILRSTASWSADEELGATYDSEVISRFLKYFTFNSARLEGSNLSFGATVEILNDPDSFKDDEQKIIIVNHGRAVDWLVKCVRNPEYDIEEELAVNSKPVKELHMLLMNGLLSDDTEGEIRERSVEISHSSYIPTSDAEMLETDLNQIAIKASAIKNVYERGFFLLLYVSYLQAFYDGNKRTARLISNLPLISDRRTPHAFVEVDEDSYHKAIVFYYETGDHRPLEQLWFESYIQGSRLFDSLRKDFKTSNLPKVELNPLKILAVKAIVENGDGRKDFRRRIKEIFQRSALSEKYDLELFQSMVSSACDKLAKGRLGGSIYALSNEQIESWAKNWDASSTRKKS